MLLPSCGWTRKENISHAFSSQLQIPKYSFQGKGEKGIPPLLGVMAQLGACVSSGAHGKENVHQIN